MKMQCPKCHQGYEFDEKQNGQIFSCLECSEDFVISPPELSPVRKKAPEWLLVVLGLTGSVVLFALIGGGLFFFLSGKKETPKTERWNVPAQENSFVKQALNCIENGDSGGFAKAVGKLNFALEEKETAEQLLFAAVRKKNKDMIQILLSADVQLDLQNKKGEAVLVEAARGNDLNMMEFLISKGAKLDGDAYTAETPLGIAAEKGYLEIVTYLIGAMDSVLEGGKTEKSLFRAIRNGHVECVREILKKCDIEERDKNGNTVLLAALAAKNRPLVQLAIEKKANVEAVNNQGVPALFLAVSANDPALMELFKGVKINTRQTDLNGTTLPMVALQTGNIELLQQFLTAENINQRDKSGKNILFYAAAQKDFRAFDLLLEKKADWMGDSFENTPLYVAIRRGNAHAVSKLLEAGVPADGKDERGCNALMLAAECGNLSVFNLFSAKKYPLWAESKDGKNAYALALAGKHTEIASLLKQEMDAQTLASVLEKVDAALQSELSYQEKISRFEALKKEAGDNEKALSGIEAAKAKALETETLRAYKQVEEAIQKAEKDKYYKSAIRTLETAIAECPVAPNLKKAKEYLAKLKLKMKAEEERRAEIQKKKEALATMSQREIEKEITTFINAWLRNMRLESDTSSYWSLPFLTTTLFDVKSWDIIGVAGRWSPTYNSVKVMIESSNKGGSPIRRTWAVSINRDDNLNWKILSLE